jgi:hypothetical protein
MLFEPGDIYITRGIAELVENGAKFAVYFRRHFEGDWGDMCEEDCKENELSLKEGFRLMSSYATEWGKVWIITEADRSVTTMLLPSEY